MVLGISSTKSSSSSTEAAEAYHKKQQQNMNPKKSPARAVASLIACCAAPEQIMDDGGFRREDDDDNDSFVTPRPIEGVEQRIGGGGIGGSNGNNNAKPPKKQNTNDGFASAVKQQQQRNRFTSSPLIERDSSLVKEQSGLLSFLSSGTFNETSPREIIKSGSGGGSGTTNNNHTYMNPMTMARNRTPPTPSMVNQSTPPRSARRKHHQQQQHSPSSNHSYSSNNNQQQQVPPPPLASPAMELSMARQSANAMTSSSQYQPLLRGRRQQQQHNHNLGPSITATATNNVADTVAAMTIESPTKKARQDDDDSITKSTTSSQQQQRGLQGGGPSSLNSSILQPSLSIEETYSAADTLPPSPSSSTHKQQLKQSSSPTTTKSLRIVPQTSSVSSTEVMATTSEHKKNIVIWKHYTKAALNSNQEGHLHHSRQSLIWNSTSVNNGGDGRKINDELNMSYKFPRMYLQNPTVLDAEFLKREESCWWYKLQSGVESTLGHVRSESIKEQVEGTKKQQQQYHRGSDVVLVSSKSTKSSFSTSPNSTSNKSINNNTNGDFSPAAQPTNVWSEPSASTMKVRGPTYAQDGVKIPSEESMFAILGVDNFVKDKEEGGNNDCRSGTSSFMERWKSVCEDVGVETVPFLLVFNFIVPWGNFQTYLIRPDADNGPYSTRHADRPSEKAWRTFLESDTEYRNKVLKFIPRIVAGPWMVKKMVGSTPAIIGQKLPVSYSGSTEENYLEVSLDVTQGPALGNTIANTVAGKADVVTVDLGFAIQGQDADGTLPEQMLGLARLHHFNMKRAFTHAKWKEELRLRSQS